MTEDVAIRDNVVVNNNLPNPGSGFVALLPPGTGILNVDADFPPGIVSLFPCP